MGYLSATPWIDVPAGNTSFTLYPAGADPDTTEPLGFVSGGSFGDGDVQALFLVGSNADDLGSFTQLLSEEPCPDEAGPTETTATPATTVPVTTPGAATPATPVSAAPSYTG